MLIIHLIPFKRVAIQMQKDSQLKYNFNRLKKPTNSHYQQL